MNSHVAAGSAIRRRIFIFVGVALICATVLMVFQWQPAPAPQEPPPVERLRHDLVLREGQLFDDDTPFTGFVVERYGGGELKSRSAVSNGFLEGLSEGWHTNGVIQVREYFVRGVSHGIRTKFYPNGNKLSVAKIVSGTVEGHFERWHENGQLAEVITLSNGVAHGESLAFHPDGSLKARVQLEQGKVVTQDFWKPGERVLPPEPMPPPK